VTGEQTLSSLPRMNEKNRLDILSQRANSARLTLPKFAEISHKACILTALLR
jgi:hypothetical protein